MDPNTTKQQTELGIIIELIKIKPDELHPLAQLFSRGRHSVLLTLLMRVQSNRNRCIGTSTGSDAISSVRRRRRSSSRTYSRRGRSRAMKRDTCASTSADSRCAYGAYVLL